jgi:hypothetical protein
VFLFHFRLRWKASLAADAISPGVVDWNSVGRLILFVKILFLSVRSEKQNLLAMADGQWKEEA